MGDSTTGLGSAAKFCGGQLRWLSILGNQYALGADALNTPGRIRYHTDDSVQVKYYDNPGTFISKAAFSLTGDLGCEHGGGVSCTGNSAKGPKQSFIGFMVVQPALVPQGPLWLHVWRRKDQQPGTLSGFVAPDQWSNGHFGNPLFHREPGRPLQGMGHFRDLRLHAQPVHYVPLGVSTIGRRTCRISLDQEGSRPQAAIRARRVLWCRDWTPDLVKDENRMNWALLVKF